MNMKNIKGRRMPFENEIQYTKELMENHPDPSAEWGESGSEYTAGTGITISDEDVISIDNTVVATKSDIPTNYVTTNTDQEITGEKTFKGNKRIKFKGNATNSRLGFTGFDNEGKEIGYLEMQKSDTSFTGNPISNILGYWSNTASSGPTPSKDPMLGFKYQTKDSNGDVRNLNLVVPTRATLSYDTRYIPISVNGTLADNTGNIGITIPAAVSGTNDGTNWTSLTIGSDTYGLASGGSGGGTLIFNLGDPMHPTQALLTALQDSSNIGRIVITRDKGQGHIYDYYIYTGLLNNKYIFKQTTDRPGGSQKTNTLRTDATTSSKFSINQDYLMYRAWGTTTTDQYAIPAVPDTDGTYVLKCVVSNSTKTWQWVLES